MELPSPRETTLQNSGTRSLITPSGKSSGLFFSWNFGPKSPLTTTSTTCEEESLVTSLTSTPSLFPTLFLSTCTILSDCPRRPVTRRKLVDLKLKSTTDVLPCLVSSVSLLRQPSLVLSHRLPESSLPTMDKLWLLSLPTCFREVPFLKMFC